MAKKLEQQKVAEILAEYLLQMEDMVAETVTKVLNEKYGELLKLIEKKAVPGLPGAKGEKGDAGERIIKVIKTETPVVQERVLLQPIATAVRNESTIFKMPVLTPEDIKQLMSDIPLKEPWFEAGHIKGIVALIRRAAADMGQIKLGGGQGSWTEVKHIGTGDGVTTSFQFSPAIPNSLVTNSLSVYLGESPKRLNDHYTATNGSTSSITFLVAPASGIRIFVGGQNG